MKANPVLENHYGMDVWVSPLLEELRHSECLCFSCTKLVIGGKQEDNCRIASLLYAVCRETGIAAPVVRCPAFDAEPDH
jgi:hypothetical protein